MTENEPGRIKMVVGVDGSPESLAALRWASRYGAACGGTIRAVQAWHYPSAVGPAPIGKAPPAVTEEVEERIRGDLVAAITGAGPDVTQVAITPHVRYGHPAEVLIDESQDADLLVVGHKGHGAFAEMLTGSVSLHCVNHAACPVTVVRPTTVRP